MSGSRKLKVFDQLPIWLVELVALTLQYQVLPASSGVDKSNVWLVMSKPLSFQLVAIMRSEESKVSVVSNSTDHPPIETPAVDRFHANCGVLSGAGLIPVSIDHEPFRGLSGVGSEGTASEPGTYTKEISGLLVELAEFG